MPRFAGRNKLRLFRQAGPAQAFDVEVQILLALVGRAGTLVPIGLNRLGADPVIASSAFVTTVTDVVGFFAFLGLAAVFLF